MAIIYPSLISADLLNLRHEIERFDPLCPGYHLDIMDHHFVPNLTWGPLFCKAIAQITTRQLWVHLMVTNPSTLVDELVLPPKSIVTFHTESTIEKIELIKKIREKKWLAGIAISPKTPAEEIFHFLHLTYQVLIMSVEPGFSGQPFLTSVEKKLETLVAYRKAEGLEFNIAMDGGINADNIAHLTAKGVNQFAIADAIFDQRDPLAAYQRLVKLAA